MKLLKSKLLILFILLLLLGINTTGYTSSLKNLYQDIQKQVNKTETSKERLNILSEQNFKIVGFTNLNIDNILKNKNKNEIIYFVQPGDSLYTIAMKFNTTIRALKKENKLKTNQLLINQKLIIPIPNSDESDSGDSDTGKPDTDTPETPDKIYYVQPGDSLYKIAQKFETTIEKIKEENNLETDELMVDQKLIIPVPASDTPDFDKSQFEVVLSYEVKSDDNLIMIASKFNISTQTLKLYNDLTSNTLWTGQELLIPLDISENNINEKFNVTPEELGLLARAVHSEARGEPFKGQVAVAAVILNRVRHSFFPDNIRDVIFQPWQFSAVHDGQFWLDPGQQAFVAARAALKGWDPTKGAIYYYNPKTATSDWVFYRNVVIKIGDHYFAV